VPIEAAVAMNYTFGFARTSTGVYKIR
jgi:hypothetical protein